MKSVFDKAAGRHLDDARLLFGGNRFDNAAYLAGYVAECSAKVLLVQSDKLAPKEYGHDLKALSTEAIDLATLLAPFVGRYRLVSSPELEELGSNWTVYMRYTDSGQVSKATAETWLRASEHVYRSIVIKAILDGRIGG